MSVSGLDKNGDWQFGRGLATYQRRQNEVLQKVGTRLKSFKDNWFLDTEANIDWFYLLGYKNTLQKIDQEVRRVTLGTDGVVSIDDLQLIKNDKTRGLLIQLKITTVFDSAELGITI